MAGLFRRRKAKQDAGHGALAVFGCFLRIGASSFGGGSATIVAMRQAALARGWLTEQEFLDTLVLSRLTPGITILAQVLLIGRKVCGLRGMVAAAVGMLTPSIGITIGLARLYQLISGSPRAASPLRCVAAVAAGFAVALALALLRDTLKRSTWLRSGPLYLGYLGLGLLIGNPPVVLIAAITAGLVLPGLFEGTETVDDP